MADAPWRCSQCGTVNEPVANACRTCGRWPSLFDLEQETIDADPPDVEADVSKRAPSTPRQLDPEVFDVGGDEVEMPTEFEADGEDQEDGPAKPVWQRFARLIVPIGVVLYILISSLANR